MKVINWKEYGDLCDKLFKDIMLLKFDGVIGIGRGGIIIGAILAHKMGIPVIYPVFVRHVGVGEEMRVVVSDLGKIQSLTKGNMLLTDDSVVTGKALNLVKNYISKSVHLKTLAVACWKFTKVKPDFVGFFVDEDFMFPYDVAPAKIL